MSKLITLKASDNKIREIAVLSGCKKIIKLKLDNNKIYDLTRTLTILSGLPKLLNLTLAGNPCVTKTKDAKKKILSTLELEKLENVLVEKTSKFAPCLIKASYVRNKLNLGIPANFGTLNQDLEKQVIDLKHENYMLKEELNRLKSQITRIS